MRLSVAGELRRSLMSVARGALVLSFLTFAAYKLHLNAAGTGFLYLTAVVLNCLDSSFPAATVLSVLAVAALDYFFIDPLFTWNVSNPIDTVALACFLVTSVVVTRLAAKAREEAKSAMVERQNLRRLYEVAQQLLTLDLFEGEHQRILAAVQRVFDFKVACIFDAATAEVHAIGDNPGQVAELTRAAYIGNKDYDDPDLSAAFRCLRLRPARTMAGANF